MLLDLCPVQTDAEAQAAELAPILPVPGVGADRPLLYHRDDELFICIDRRDGQLAIERGEHVVILPAQVTQALSRFLRAGQIQSLLSQLPA